MLIKILDKEIQKSTSNPIVKIIADKRSIVNAIRQVRTYLS